MWTAPESSSQNRSRVASPWRHDSEQRSGLIVVTLVALHFATECLDTFTDDAIG